MKKIIFYNSNLDFSLGEGSASFEKNIISYLYENSLVNSKYKIIFFTPNKEKSFTDNHICVELNKKSKISYFKHQILLFFKMLKQLYHYRNYNISIYVRTSGLILAPVLLAFLFSKKLIIRSGAGMKNMEYYHDMNNKLKYSIYKKYFSFCLKVANKVIVVTEGIKKALNEDFNVDLEKVHVIPNPANEKLFRRNYQNENSSLSKKQNNTFNIGYVGSIVKEQRLQDIIHALGILKTQGKLFSGLKFLIIGGGDFTNDCKKIVKNLQLENTIEFVGKIPQENLVEYYAQLDCCVAPYSKVWNQIKGSSAMKISEYLIMNKFVIAANIEDYQFIEEENFGLLYEIESPSDVAEKILHAFSNRNILKIYSQKYILKNRSSDIIFKKYIDLIIHE